MCLCFSTVIDFRLIRENGTEMLLDTRYLLGFFAKEA